MLYCKAAAIYWSLVDYRVKMDNWWRIAFPQFSSLPSVPYAPNDAAKTDFILSVCECYATRTQFTTCSIHICLFE